MVMATIEEEGTQMATIEEEDTQEEEEDPWTTKDGMKNSPQEEEEDRAGSKKPGKNIRTSNGPTEIRICNQVVIQSLTPIEMMEIMRWESITPQTMGTQERGKEAQVLEGIQTGTIAQEVAKTGEEETGTLAQEVTEMVDMVGEVRATTAEETARGP